MKQATSWERVLLPNGLKVLYVSRPSDVTLRLCVAVDYGANDDSADEAGLAHLLEHLLSAGSRKRAENAERIEHFGGSLNFFISPYYTFAYAHIPCDKLIDSSRILSEIIFDGKFENPRFQKEKKVVLEEIAEEADSPWRRVGNKLRKALFGEHPVGRPLVGFRETVENLSVDSIMRAHQSYYQPQNVIAMVVGRYDKAEAEIALKAFRQPANAKQKTGLNRKNLEGPKSLKREIVEEVPDITQAYIAVGARTVPATHPDSCALDVIQQVLGRGESSRLFKELREKRGLAYTVESTHSQGQDYGLFAVWTAVNNRNVEKTRRLLRTHFERIGSEPLSERELRKGKEMAKGEILRSLDDPTGGPRLLAEAEILYNDYKAVDRYLARIQAIGADRIQAVAAEYLESGRLVTVVLKPRYK